MPLVFRTVRLAGAWLLAIAFQLAVIGVALAADKEEESSGSKPYYLMYFLVIVLVLLGVAAVCRPVARKRDGEDGTFGAFLPDLDSKSGEAKKNS